MNKKHTIFIDSHVHFYDCFDLSGFLSAAQNNFRKAASQAGLEKGYSAILLLSERNSENWFQWLVDRARENPLIDQRQNRTWQLQYNEKDVSIKVFNDHYPPLFIIPGRQVVTKDSIEVLLLGTAETYEGRVSLLALLKSVRDKDLISVMPWGVGKWLGKRGDMVKKTIINETGRTFFIGDIAGRPVFWPEPSLFQLAAETEIRLLQGTDPLPLPDAVSVAGSYGFSITMPQPRERHAQQIKKKLLDPETITVPYGAREKPLKFLRNQILLRVKSS